MPTTVDDDATPPITAEHHDLDALLAAMTDDTFPDEPDFGIPVGHEVW